MCCGQKHCLINFGDMLQGTSCTEEAAENVKENQEALLPSPNLFLVCLLWAQNNQGTLLWSPSSFFVCLLLPQNDQGALLQRSNFLLSLLFMTSDPMNKFLIISYFAEIRIYCFWQITDQHSRMKLMNVRTWSTLYDTWPCVSISNSLPQRNFRGNLMWHMRTDIGKTQWLWSLEPGS